MAGKPLLKIRFVDFASDFIATKSDFYRLLHKHFEIDLYSEPDFVFYSNFGGEHFRYNCVRIFYTGECEIPDFNVCDYAIGFDYLSFGDRYLRYPLYKLFQYRRDLERAVSYKRSDVTEEARSEFCSFVVSNDSGMPERKKMLDLLSKYKLVHSGGRYLNNVGGPVADKDAFQSKHKFALCFENSSYAGYTTEKIVQAFASGCIPIYFGNPRIEEEFNGTSFVNCHRFSSLEDAARYVQEIDGDSVLYQSMLSTPISKVDLLDETMLEKFLLHIVSQGKDRAIRRPLNVNGKRHEKQLYDGWKRYNRGRFARRFKRLLQRVKHKSL